MDTGGDWTLSVLIYNYDELINYLHFSNTRLHFLIDYASHALVLLNVVRTYRTRM